MTDTQQTPPPSCAIVIFGANGDLTKRLVVPALYNLARNGLLPPRFSLIGVDHNNKSATEWCKDLKDFHADALAKGGEGQAAQLEERYWQPVAEAMDYLPGDFEHEDTYRKLAECLAAQDKKRDLEGNVLFYLAVADRFFSIIARELGKAGLLKQQADGGFRRIIVEKPFGHDLVSAKALNACLWTYLEENQIYRIDHFLGKETVQNIMALRFANSLFEPTWNRDRIDHVQITAAESIGIGTRGKFYEHTGALRDMVPNHLFQLAAMTAVEPPVSLSVENIRDKRAELFGAIHPLRPEDVVRGQYSAGHVDGEDAPAYRAEEGVPCDSTVETFVAVRVNIDNWRWAGVPFYLRTGKRLAKRVTEVAIRFKRAPHALFRDTSVESLDADWLILRIQPDEGIRLSFNAKRPGPAMALEHVAMDFAYKDWFDRAPAVGYETLIYDCLTGDATLFQRADQVEAAWRIVEPVLTAWADTASSDISNYAAGSEGPDAAARLLADGHRWRSIA